MDADLAKLCESIFCEHVDKLFAGNRLRRRQHEGRTYVEAPILGEWCLPEQIKIFKPAACRALMVQAAFEIEKPDWAPRLPTSADAIDKMKREPRCRLKLVGYYASSRQNVNWGPHPNWEDYLAGLAALPPPPGVFDVVQGANLAIRPRLLPGLERETMRWGPPERPPAKLAAPVETGLARAGR
jgi:hypothetical protein